MILNAECRVQNAKLRVTSFRIISGFIYYNNENKRPPDKFIIKSFKFSKVLFCGIKIKVCTYFIRDRNFALCILHFAFFTVCNYTAYGNYTINRLFFQVRFVNSLLQWGQLILILPLFLGTRKVRPQPGQL